VTIAARTKLTPAAQIDLKRSAQKLGKETTTCGAEPRRTDARAVKRIYDRGSGELVGWLYEWNTGALVPRWKSETYEDVFYD